MMARPQRGASSSRRCTSANSDRMPPSPSLSARMISMTYLSVTIASRLQNISDSTPSSVAGRVRVGPVAFSDCSSAYSGLVPMSP